MFGFVEARRPSQAPIRGFLQILAATREPRADVVCLLLALSLNATTTNKAARSGL